MLFKKCGHYSGNCPCLLCQKECYGCFDALDMAISALRAQQKATNNAPLTLDELRKMDGEPVWCVSLGASLFRGNGWYIGANNWYMDEYGKTWLAYSRKPEEADHV